MILSMFFVILFLFFMWYYIIRKDWAIKTISKILSDISSYNLSILQNSCSVNKTKTCLAFNVFFICAPYLTRNESDKLKEMFENNLDLNECDMKCKVIENYKYFYDKLQIVILHELNINYWLYGKPFCWNAKKIIGEENYEKIYKKGY